MFVVGIPLGYQRTPSPSLTQERKMERMTTQPKHEPSPAEIAEACLEIQATWSIAEKQRRLRVDWRPQVRTADDRLADVDADDFQTHERKGRSCQK